MEISGSILNGDGIEVPIRKVKHGEIITQDGIYDMPMSWYHDDCCEGPSISSSGIRTILNKSPLHYWHGSKLNPDRPEDKDDEDKAHYRIGRAGHTLLLEPSDFSKTFVTRPPIYDSWRTNDSKKWRAEAIANGLTVLDPAEMQGVHGVAQALRRHPLYEQGLLDGDIERSLIWKDEKSGIWLKSRPDAIPQGSNMFSDLKVVADASPRAANKSIYGYGYDVQMGMGAVGMWVVLRRKMEEFAIVNVEAKPPHGILISPIPPEDIADALILLRHGINIFKECWEAGEWPSYDESDTEYSRRPEWQRNKIKAGIESGKLPKEF